MLALEIRACDVVLAERTRVLGNGFACAGEALRALAIASRRRRDEFLAGRWLARCVLSRTLGRPPLHWPLTHDAGTAPTVTGIPGLCISISHAGEHVACALADHPVGVDIERIDARRDVDGLARIVLHDEERSALASLASGDRARRFASLWTLKESWLKQRGEGLDFARMRGLRARPAGAGPADALTWHCRDAGLVISVASPEVRERMPASRCDPRIASTQWHAFAVQEPASFASQP